MTRCVATRHTGSRMIRSGLQNTGTYSLVKIYKTIPAYKDIFACFSDALPDRWGRTLLNRREQIAASEEKRPLRRLTSFDYLMGIDDESRMGGYRFAETPGGKFINCETCLRVPPLASVREHLDTVSTQPKPHRS